jgi:multiple sugar transport system substrate-binding protein
MFQYNWAQLYANAVTDVSDVAGELGKAEGGFYDIYPPADVVNGKWMALPHSIVGNAVAYRKSWLKEAGASQYPKTWEEAHKLFAALKKKGKPYGQTLGHTFGDAPTFTYCMLWAFGGMETDKTGKKVVLNGKGRGRLGEVHAVLLEGLLRRGRAGVGRHQQQPRLPRGRDLGHPERGVDLHRGQAAEGEDQGRQGRADVDRHRPRAPAGRSRGRIPALPEPLRRDHEVQQEPKLAKDFLRWVHKPDNFGKWFASQEGYSVGATKKWENDPMWGKLDEPLKMFRTAARNTRLFGYAGPSTPRPPRPSPSTSSPTCTPRASRA